MIKKICILVSLVCFKFAAAEQSVYISSPDGSIKAEVFVDQSGRLSCQVQFEGQTVIEKSDLGITVDDIDYGSGFAVDSVKSSTSDNTYSTRGVHSFARDHHNQQEITLKKGLTTYKLQARAFNDGFAYRYIINGNGSRTVKGETSSWKITPDSKVWYFERPNFYKLKSYAGYWLKTNAENLHKVSPKGPIQGPPLVVELPDNKGYMLISEAALYNYSGMRLKSLPGRIVQANFTEGSAGFRVDGTITSPWRAAVIVKELNGLVNSDLISNLNPDPDPKLFSDTSYIKPGRSVWRWITLGTGTPEEEMDFVDYAAELGFEYTIVDDGWISWENNWENAEKICAYAREKSVGVFFWANSNMLDNPEDNWKDMRDFMDNLKKAGAAGVKIDFMNSESKKTIDFEIAALTIAAQRKLMVNFHGCHKSTGESRTYPNEITREGIRGLELNRMGEGPVTASHNAALPFTRFAVGHADYTPLGYHLAGPTTWAHQLATAILFTSPMQVISENPDILLHDNNAKRALDVLMDIPAVWDETIVLDQSKIGVLAMFARKRNTKWFLAAINGKEQKQELKDISLSFLEDGVKYKAIVISSGKPLIQAGVFIRQVFKRQEFSDITSNSTIDIPLDPNDGYVAEFIPDDQAVHTVRNGNCHVKINSDGFKFCFTDGQENITAPPHSVNGLQINRQPVIEVNKKDSSAGGFDVCTKDGQKAEVYVTINDGVVCFKVIPENTGINDVSISTGGMPVAHGLGDAGGYGPSSFNLVEDQAKTYSFLNNGGSNRWISTFAVFPENNLAGVFFDEGEKYVTLSKDQYSMAIKTQGAVSFYYFLGDMHTIYKNYLSLRKQYGYANIKPKFRLFELGWETWDALKYNTSIDAVEDAVEELLKEGYPIRWLVTGSGFWEEGGTTTSFGKFGKQFQNHEYFRVWLKENNLKWLIGFRSNMLPPGGPYPSNVKPDGREKPREFKGNPLSQYALDNDYFLKSPEGEVIKIASRNYPQTDCYMIDGRKPDAAEWFIEQYDKWRVDGIKEDTMMNMGTYFDIFNGPSALIAEQGGLVMARCGSYSSPGTLLRINDTYGAKSMQRRCPLNYMQYAACGAPNVYSDTIGFGNIDNAESSIRHGWLMSVTAGLAMGKIPPDTWTAEQKNTFKKMVNFHYALAPYMYDAAIKSYDTGYPYTLTPLSIAYPEDKETSKLEHYQWMVGESVLAAPLVKNYKSCKLDLYLPEGVWFDYDSGEKFVGPVTLSDFKMPLEKTPCFVGGRGIVILRESDESPLKVKIYPIAREQTEFTFNYPDGVSQSIIELKALDNKITVIDSAAGSIIPFEVDALTGAISFDIQPGHNYKLK
ncbi:Retaining alpha-galactosidase precursor [Limihaloglobus sulfuriphilus]|uniref:Retaining alpha-galactosidase n=1 Tax=Limihaloglobus sulfuriphilus TaxID=1851148 RepID=A0A1Q2MJB7_9BACT|nr:glycoside hydrolase family 97 catalytic domain-containing protein [Limihaloglobus sulfuriphilus]AQQ72482.1 Retaining alpha-galactosidase precursor [Limihaloglobus sulfuriphilus]